MSLEANKALVRRMVEDTMTDVDAALAAYAPDLVYHAPIMDDAAAGTPPITVMGEAIRLTRSAFTDLRYTVEALIAEDDLVAVLYSWSGTQLGPLGPLPATGRTVGSTGVIVCRVAGGRIVEQWDVDDRLDVMLQLGVIGGPLGT